MIAQKELAARISVLVDMTKGSWSFDRYGEREWRRTVRLLIDRGLDDREIEAVLRSKWMRWAADNCADTIHFKPRGEDVIRFMDDRRNRCDVKALNPRDVRGRAMKCYDFPNGHRPFRLYWFRWANGRERTVWAHDFSDATDSMPDGSWMVGGAR